MWSHPGKKLVFMGGEIAQDREWNHDRELDWFLLDDPAHAGIQRLVRDLNRVYRGERSLHARDAEPAGSASRAGSAHRTHALPNPRVSAARRTPTPPTRIYP